MNGNEHEKLEKRSVGQQCTAREADHRHEFAADLMEIERDIKIRSCKYWVVALTDPRHHKRINNMQIDESKKQSILQVLKSCDYFLRRGPVQKCKHRMNTVEFLQFIDNFQ